MVFVSFLDGVKVSESGVVVFGDVAFVGVCCWEDACGRACAIRSVRVSVLMLLTRQVSEEPECCC